MSFSTFLSPLLVLPKARTKSLLTPWKEASRGNLAILSLSRQWQLSSQQLSSKQILQLINGISNDLKILNKYFRGATIFAFSNAPLAPAVATRFPKMLDLHLKDDESSIITSPKFPASVILCSSPFNCHKLPKDSS